MQWQRQGKGTPIVQPAQLHCLVLAKKKKNFPQKWKQTDAQICVSNMPRAANNEGHCFEVKRSHDTNVVGQPPTFFSFIWHTKQLVRLCLAFEDFRRESTSKGGETGWLSKTRLVMAAECKTLLPGQQDWKKIKIKKKANSSSPQTCFLFHADLDTCDNNSPLKTRSESGHTAALPGPAEGFTTYYYHGLPPSIRMTRPLTHSLALNFPGFSLTHTDPCVLTDL